MNQYSITIILSNGNKVESKSVGENQEEALDKLMKLDKFVEFVGDAEIVKVDILPLGTVISVNPDNYILQESKEKQNHYVVTDKVNNVVVVFERGKYNETAKITPLYDFPKEPIGIATILKDIGEYLALYHKEIV